MSGEKMGEFFQSERCYILFYLFQCAHPLMMPFSQGRRPLNIFFSITDALTICTEHTLQQDDLLA